MYNFKYLSVYFQFEYFSLHINLTDFGFQHLLIIYIKCLTRKQYGYNYYLILNSTPLPNVNINMPVVKLGADCRIAGQGVRIPSQTGFVVMDFRMEYTASTFDLSIHPLVLCNIPLQTKGSRDKL